MKDTRVLHIIANIAAAMDGLDELLGEDITDADRISLTGAMKLLKTALPYLHKAVEEELVCQARGGFTRRQCQLPDGHSGKHDNNGFEWDAESEAAMVSRLGKLD